MKQDTEAELLRALLVRGSELGAKLFRNQVGKYLLADGRWLSSGLCVGSPDLVGWLPVTITPDMVGQRLAVFVGVEAKGPRGVVSPGQSRFLAALAADGAIQLVAWSTADLERVLS